jgi:hypothetical protein
MQSIQIKGRGFADSVRTNFRDAVISYSQYSATPTFIRELATSLTKGDSRPYLLDQFFKRYKSPLYGYGEKIVEEADSNDIDWRLVAGIGFQESNLCARIPKDSNNCWGWAVYTGKQSGKNFRNFDHAIEVISSDLATKYYMKGLDTVEKIMSKYTPSSRGSWAEGVNYAFNVIENPN